MNISGKPLFACTSFSSKITQRHKCLASRQIYSLFPRSSLSRPWHAHSLWRTHTTSMGLEGEEGYSWLGKHIGSGEWPQRSGEMNSFIASTYILDDFFDFSKMCVVWLVGGGWRRSPSFRWKEISLKRRKYIEYVAKVRLSCDGHGGAHTGSVIL